MNLYIELEPFFKKTRKKWIWGAVFIVLSNFFDVYKVLFIGAAINDVKNNLETGVFSWQPYAFNAGALLLMAIISGVFRFYMRQMIIVASREIEFEQKNQIYRHYLTLSQSFLKNNRIGDLMNRATEDVAQVRMFIGPGVMYVFNTLVLLIILLFFMLQIDVWVTLFTLAPLPVLSVLIYFVSRNINQRSKEVQKAQSAITAFVQDTFSGIRLIKSFNRERFIERKYGEETENYRNRAMRLAKMEAFFLPLMVVLIGLSNLLILYVGGMRFVEGAISIGEIANFFIYINMLIWPFTSLGWVTSLYQKAVASQERIKQFLMDQNPILDAGKMPFKNGDICFHRVNFSYLSDLVIRDVSLTIPQGSFVSILGKTGSGKSSLIQLLTRLYEPTSGEITIGEHSLKNFSLGSLLAAIGYVPQENFLFSDTIKNNILVGNPAASQTEIERAAQMACIHQNILNFEKGYETMVGERGVTLSGGQKQRICIARALLKHPDILILDDALSAVDTQTESIILENLSKLKGMTKIVVTQRVSVAKASEMIFVLHNGNIIQSGTHEQLIAIEGYYKELYDLQFSTQSFNEV